MTDEMPLAGRRICILGAFAPSMIIFRLPLIDGLQELGAEVAVGIPVAELPSEHLSILQGRGVTILDLPVDRHGTGMLSNLRYIRSVWRAIRSFKADTLIPYTIKPVTFGTIGARLGGVRSVFPLVTGLGSAFIGDAATLRSKLVRKVASRLYRTAFQLSDTVFFQNNDDPVDLRQMGVLRAGVAFRILSGSGVNIERFRPGREVGSSPMRFLMISRLLKDKGVLEFVEAARLVAQENAAVEFELVGPFDSNPTSIQPAEVKSWTWIKHTAWIDDVRPSILSCSVYVLPSYREGTPRSVLEAMACGKAVITTDAPGCREPVKDGVNGVLVPVKDASAVAAAMRHFIANPKLALTMGQEGRRIAVEVYDERKVYHEVFAYLVNVKRR